jgi:hypothetical protein
MTGWAGSPVLMHEGEHVIYGRNPNGSAYEGVLRLRWAGDTIEGQWAIGNARFVGIGATRPHILALAFAPEDGSWYGLACFRGTGNGVLYGMWLTNGGELSVEIATRGRRSAIDQPPLSYDVVNGDLLGQWDASGTAPGATQGYQCPLTLDSYGKGYVVKWWAGERVTMQGIALAPVHPVPYLASAFVGSGQLGLALYDVHDDDRLDGIWAVGSATTLGQERCQRR